MTDQRRESLLFYLYFDALMRKMWRKIWKISEKYLSLQRQNVCFDYAAECGE